MIYTRPIHRHRPAVRILAAVSLVAMLVLGFLGNPPQVHAQVVEWKDPAGLPALNGNDATGRAAPAPLDVRIDGSYPVSASVTPTLEWRSVPASVGQARFEITTLAEKNPKVLWSATVAVGSDRVATARVPAGVLAQGRTYAWSAVASADSRVRTGPFGLTVDVQRAGAQPVWTFRNLAVAQATGELVYTWKGPQLSTVAGPLSWTLVHRPTNTRAPGMPDGWRLAVSGTSRWEALRLNDDGSVTLTTATGGAVTYVKRGGDQWQPQVGRFNSAGETTLLAQNADGTFSATDGNRTVTVFSKPTVNQAGNPTRVWVMDAPTVQQQWSDGRLRALTDPVTDNMVVFLYGGDEACAAETDPGFRTAPAGELCGVVDWAGNIIALQYVDTDAGPQIGRIVKGLGTGPFAESSDIGWDASGRIAEVRDPFATTAVASGAVEGLGAQDPRAFTQIAYDARGRVASLTAPASLISGDEQPAWREARAKRTFGYGPFTVDAAGVPTATGVQEQTWLDPVTLRPTKTRDASGNVTTYEYDADGNLVRTTDVASGTVTAVRYNRQGRPVEQVGPTRGTLTSPTAPRTQTAYDQDEQGRDWKGLAMRYWSNAGFTGTPAGGTTGPVLPGGAAPIATLSANWSTSPTGTAGPWSARLTGSYEAPQAGTYAFTNTTAARLWVNGRLCAPSCSASAPVGGSIGLQVDLVSSTGEPAGINVLVTTPDGRQAAVPNAQLRPDYGLTTSTTVREALGDGTTRDLVTRMVYDQVTTQLLKTILPSGATQSRTYEPYDPARGLWGRSTSVTDASGRTTTSTYYAADAVATDCTGRQIAQQGALQSTTFPNGTSIRQVASAAGGATAMTDGSTSTCGTVTSGGFEATAETTGTGAPVRITSIPFYKGDPLTSATTTTAEGETVTEITKLDMNGDVWKTIDEHGTTTIRQVDPLSGRLVRTIETTKQGESRTMEYTYARSGDIATLTANGNRLVTNEYATDGTLLRSVLGNGAVRTFELDQQNNGRRTTTTFPDGTVLTETQTHGPSGRLLARTISGPDGTATYDYDYNRDGRLVGTRLSGTIPAKARGWQSDYAGPDGLNGNRASETTTGADGEAATATFTYGPDNRLVSASGGRLNGTLEYDAAGRATKVGAVSLAYDAAGHLLSAADGDRTYTFTDRGSTTTLTRTIDGEQRTLSVTASGESLALGADGRIDAQLVGAAPAVKVVLNQAGDPVRWIYDDSLGSAAWTSRGDAAPRRTQLYAPDGEEIAVQRVSAPVTPVDLMLDGLGWMGGRGATTLRLATPLMVIGARTYTPDGGRWLQADPSVNGAFNAYEYALGDPINMVDPDGHASYGWLWGGIAAAVAGTMIGVFTFGIGIGAVGAYGYAALAAQVAVGLVAGAVSGAVGEVVTQIVDTGAVTDWSSVAIAVGIGAGTGAIFAGISGATAKIAVPKRQLQLLAANTHQELRTISPMRGYAAIRQVETRKLVAAGVAEEEAEAMTKGVWRNMFTKRSWKAQMRANAKAASERDSQRFSLGSIFGDDSTDSLLRNSNRMPSARPVSAADDALQEAQSLHQSARGNQTLSRSLNLNEDLIEQPMANGKLLSGSSSLSEMDYRKMLEADILRGSMKSQHESMGVLNDYIWDLIPSR